MKAPEPPKIPPPTRLASPYDRDREREKYLQMAAQRSRGGYVSTILSESLRDKVGGGGFTSSSRSA